MAGVISSAWALRALGFRQTIKGAVILGSVIGCMALIQGLGYVGAYPTQESRHEFALSLASTPALGVIYGEPKNLTTPEGYMVYRVITVMSLIASIWGIAVVTKLLRGQEEDGRLELVLAGTTSLRHTTTNLLVGFLGSLLAAFCLTTVCIGLIGMSPDVSLSPQGSFLMSLAIYLPALLFSTLGVFVSQLSITRRRAFLYGMSLLVGLFVLRAIGTVATDWGWLKEWTPFGWSNLISPVVGPHLGWISPFLVVGTILVVTGVYFSGRRDIQAGILPETITKKPNYFMLDSTTTFAIRQDISLFITWGFAALGISLLMVTLSGVAADMLQESSQGLQNMFAQFGGGLNDLKVAFLGTSVLFCLTVTLLMVTSAMAAIRSDEAKNYLDTLLSQPVTRRRWICDRLSIITFAATCILLISALATWNIANAQGIEFALGNFLLVSIATIGTVVFLLGIGTLLYGFLPRLAAVVMYVVIAWSFLVDILASSLNLGEWVTKTSLFHYITTSPTAEPDWNAFGWLVTIGISCAIIGVVRFEKRDIISE